MRTAYTYSILRYVHDPAAGESLNLGVVLCAPAARYFGARIQTNYGRLRKAFTSLDGDAHRDLMRYLQRRFDELQKSVAEELPFAPTPLDVTALVTSVLPRDDSSLQWSAIGSGLADDPELELARLYARMVTANDSPKVDAGRTDDVIWSHYRAPLAQERVLPLLRPHRVVALDDEAEFEYSWQNRHWHFLQPFSLDLLEAESIRRKAHILLGQMHGIREAVREDTLHLLVGEPQLERCRAAAEKALHLLSKQLPVSHEIVRESEAGAFARSLAREVAVDGHELESRVAEDAL